MIKFNFYLTEEYFDKLAAVKEAETDPEYKNMTFNEYARELLENAIFSKHYNLKKQGGGDLPF